MTTDQFASSVANCCIILKNNREGMCFEYVKWFRTCDECVQHTGLKGKGVTSGTVPYHAAWEVSDPNKCL